MDKDKKKIEKVKPNYTKAIGKILLILLIGFSVYLFTSTIMLIFLTKPGKEVKVPDVVGKQFIDVYSNLLRIGIKPVLKFKDIYDLDNGIILNQYPKSGEIIPESSSLKLVISRSNFYIDVPNLIGTELPIAINKLKNLHYHGKEVSLSTGIISYIPSEKSADNIVISQNPRTGEKIGPDRKINLLVSSGKLKTDNKMPDLNGQSIDLCYDLLRAKGALIHENIIKTSRMKESGIIVSQSKRKGSRIKKDDSIRLNIKWYPLKQHPYISYEKIDYKIPSDQEKGLYEAYIEDNLSKRIRFSRNMKPGQRMLFIFNRVGNAKITILRNKKTINTMSVNVEEYE